MLLFNNQNLYQYCELFKAQSVIKRLGFLLDLLEIKNPISEALQRIKSSSFILLEPSYEKKGEWIHKWNILQEILIEKMTALRGRTEPRDLYDFGI